MQRPSDSTSNSLPVSKGRVPSESGAPADVDAAFWKEQEKRRLGRLGQPCCTQSKMSWALIHMPGNFALVIHGEEDCLNCFHHHTGNNLGQVYSTRLSDYQITSGETQRPLRHLLKLVAEQRKPEAVIVLGTCPIEVIGDRFETVVEDVSNDTGIPMAALHTSGLKLTRLVEMQDWLYSTLATLGAKEEATVENRINLIGLTPAAAHHPEVRSMVESMGLTLGGVYPNATSLADWQGIGAAEKSFVVDASAFPRLTALLEERGQEVIEVPLPVGVEQTERFYRIMAESFGRTFELETAMAAHREEAMNAITPIRERLGGFPLAMAIRMLNTYRSDQLAYDGLGDFAFLRECGFELTLYVQGPPEEREAFAKTLSDRYGITNTVRVFPGPWLLGNRLRDDGFEHAIAPDSCTATLRQSHVAAIATRAFPMFFSGVPTSVSMVRSLLER